jgi:hypothetical protein
VQAPSGPTHVQQPVKVAGNSATERSRQAVWAAPGVSLRAVINPTTYEIGVGDMLRNHGLARARFLGYRSCASESRALSRRRTRQVSLRPEQVPQVRQWIDNCSRQYCEFSAEVHSSGRS